jgi:quinol-cytochrome oxidoreductase complex cytochrome b subunit
MRLGSFARSLLVLFGFYAITVVAVTLLNLSETGERLGLHHVAAWLVGAIIFVGAFAIIFGAAWLVEKGLLRPPVSRIRRTAGAIIAVAAMIGAFLAAEGVFALLEGGYRGRNDDLALAIFFTILVVPAVIVTQLVGWIRERRSKASSHPPADPVGPATPGSG